MPPFQIIMNMSDLFVKAAKADIVYNLKWVIPFCFVYICTSFSFHSSCTSIFMTPRTLYRFLCLTEALYAVCDLPFASKFYKNAQVISCYTSTPIMVHSNTIFSTTVITGTRYKREWGSTFQKDFIWLIGTYRL